MAIDFDQFPVYDPLVKRDSFLMSEEWVAFMSTFYMNLISYLTQGGILLPQLTTTQRNQLLSPQNGQMIYNTTADEPQIYKGGAWKTIVTI
jgi:hypothetical protein